MTFPNPSDASFSLLINYSRFLGEVNIMVLDANGKIFGFKELNVLEGENVYPLNVNSLEEGMYFISLEKPLNNVTLRDVFSE